MKRTYGGGRTYKSAPTTHRGGGGNALSSNKGGLKVPPMQTDTKGMGADPQKSFSAHGANVVGSRLPGDGRPRRS